MYCLNKCSIESFSTYYPNIVLKSKGKLYYPTPETVASLKGIERKYQLESAPKHWTEKCLVFFFIYNTDNYFHFLYDSLPYLINYLKLREKEEVKLLMSYPYEGATAFYPFVTETLNLLGIKESDILIADKNTTYEKLYVSESYTYKDKPPEQEVYDFYKKLIPEESKKLYISRRSWIHGDFSNIGTNYTTRRVCANEDELVRYLLRQGYSEVFPETMSMLEKIRLFNNATHIIGALGGGLCNCLFCKPTCKVLVIESPGVLEVNGRLMNVINKTDFKVFSHTSHVSTDEFLKFMRVKYHDIIGEIKSVQEKTVTINYCDNFLTGWNNEIQYKTVIAPKSECIKLDNGLNCEWQVNMNQFESFYASNFS